MRSYEENGSSHRGSYDDYDHSDEELYVYDQCCGNCRYYDSAACCCTRPWQDEFRDENGWCMEWKGVRR